MLNARTSASVNQIGYTIFPYINHKWKTKYVIYPRSADRHYTEGQDFSLSEPERIHNISLYWPWMKSYRYVTYPRSAQALYWMPGLQPGWTRKDTQHFPLLPMNIKLSMLHIPEALRHYIECQDFSLGEPKRIHNISLHWPWMKS